MSTHFHKVIIFPRPAYDFLVGLGRVELPTSRLSGVRSNQLSYRPIEKKLRTLHLRRIDTHFNIATILMDAWSFSQRIKRECQTRDFTMRNSMRFLSYKSSRPLTPLDGSNRNFCPMTRYLDAPGTDHRIVR